MTIAVIFTLAFTISLVNSHDSFGRVVAQLELPSDEASAPFFTVASKTEAETETDTETDSDSDPNPCYEVENDACLLQAFVFHPLEENYFFEKSTRAPLAFVGRVLQPPKI